MNMRYKFYDKSDSSEVIFKKVKYNNLVDSYNFIDSLFLPTLSWVIVGIAILSVAYIIFIITNAMGGNGESVFIIIVVGLGVMLVFVASICLLLQAIKASIICKKMEKLSE